MGRPEGLCEGKSMSDDGFWGPGRYSMIFQSHQSHGVLGMLFFDPAALILSILSICKDTRHIQAWFTKPRDRWIGEPPALATNS